VIPIAVFAIAFAVHAGSIGHDFVWDDPTLIAESPRFQRVSDVPALFRAHAFSGAETGMGGMKLIEYYRPVWIASLAVDHLLWGERPLGYHVTNVVLHAIAAGLVAWLALLLLGAPLAALIAGLLFAVHPSHSEAVAWVSARNELLCVVFVTLAFGAYLRFRASGSRAAALACGVAYYLGLFSKETAVVLPALALIAELRESPVARARFKYPLALLLLTLPYAALRMTLVAARHEPHGLATRLMTAPGLIARDLAILVAPFRPKVFYSLPVVTQVSAAVVLPLIAVLAYVAFAAWLRRREPNLFLGLSWALSALLPVCGIVTLPIPALIAERYLVLPSVGWAIAIGAGIAALERRRSGSSRPLVGACLALVVLLAAITIRQDRVWKNDLTLMTRMTRDAPDAAIGHAALGIAARQAGQSPLALASFRTAVRLRPDDPWFHRNLGDALATAGQDSEAEHELRAALDLGIGHPMPHLDLGKLYQRQGRVDDAVREYRAALAMDPHAGEAHAALGVILYQQNHWDEAEREYRAALAANPADVGTRQNLGGLYARQGRTAEALTELNEVVRLRPGFGEAQFNLAATLVVLGRHADAEPHFRAAASLMPNAAETHYGLGDVLSALGRREEATRELAIAARLAPDSGSYRPPRGQ
jgi:Flp pilus assembly protein TadD